MRSAMIMRGLATRLLPVLVLLVSTFHPSRGQALRNYSPDELVLFYETQREASLALKGERIQVTGTISQASRESVVFKAYSKDKITCTLSDNTLDGRIYLNRTVTVRGRSDGRGLLGNIALLECTLATDALSSHVEEHAADRPASSEYVPAEAPTPASTDLVVETQEETSALAASPPESADSPGETRSDDRSSQSNSPKPNPAESPREDSKPSSLEEWIGIAVLFVLALLGSGLNSGKSSHSETSDTSATASVPKAPSRSCRGRTGRFSCGSRLYRCLECGMVGCASKECTNNRFELGRCSICGGGHV